MVLVGLGVHEVLDLARVERFELEEPAFAVGVLVDPFRRVLECVVDRDDRAGDRGVDVRGRLHRLHHRDLRAGLDALVELRQFDVHHVAQGVLGEVADPDGHDAVVLVEARPLVAGGVA